MKEKEPLLNRLDFCRASGNCICSICKKEYYTHPYANEIKDWEDRPFLHKLCDGRLVKL